MRAAAIFTRAINACFPRVLFFPLPGCLPRWPPPPPRPFLPPPTPCGVFLWCVALRRVTSVAQSCPCPFKLVRQLVVLQRVFLPFRLPALPVTPPPLCCCVASKRVITCPGGDCSCTVIAAKRYFLLCCLSSPCFHIPSEASPRLGPSLPSLWMSRCPHYYMLVSRLSDGIIRRVANASSGRGWRGSLG